MSRQRVLEKWNEYARTVLPSGCSEIQHFETRRAFWAGAAAMFDIVTGPEVTGASDAQEGCKVMDEIVEEFELHVRQVQAGGA